MTKSSDKQKVKTEFRISYRANDEDRPEQDVQLWNAFRNGSPLALKSIYVKYINGLFSYGTSISPYQELIKDVIQDLFEELWVKRSKLGSVKYIKAYLYVSFRRKLLQKIKKEEFTFRTSDTIQFEILLKDKTLDDLDISEEKRACVLNALNSLPDRQREALFLRFYNNLTSSEIAEIMNINDQSAYNLIHRGLKLMRGLLMLISLFLMVQI